MNTKAKIFFKNTVTHTKNDALKLKKLIIINDLLLLKKVPNYKKLLNKYNFFDEDGFSSFFKKYNISSEEWFELLNGKNLKGFLDNNKEENSDNNIENKIFEDFDNFYKEININEIDHIIIEVFDDF